MCSPEPMTACAWLSVDAVRVSYPADRKDAQNCLVLDD